jgi:hypothetical protein
MSLSEVSGSGDTDRSLTLTASRQITSRLHNFSLFLYSAMSTVTAISFKPKATRKRLKKEILRDDFKKRKIFWKNIAENFLWKIFHLTSLVLSLIVSYRNRVSTNPR